MFIAPKAIFHGNGSTHAGVIAVDKFYNWGEWHYHNHELPNPVNVQFQGKKEFTNIWPSSGEYKLVLMTDDNSPMPSENTTITLDHNRRSGMFGKIYYNADYGKSGDVTYNYKIKEEAGNQTGVKYDSKEYIIKVIITYGEYGAASIKDISYCTSNDNKFVEYKNTDVFTFTNTYTVNKSVNADISIKKTVDNQIPPQDQKFKFKLVEGKKGNFNNSKIIENNVSNDNNGNVRFKTITYTNSGIHYYKIDEVSTPNKYISSGPIYVKVEVTESGEKLNSNVTYYNDLNFEYKINNLDKKVINNATKKSHFIIKKVDADSELALSGAKFKLYKATLDNNRITKGKSFGDEEITDNDGKVSFENLLYESTYLLIETQAPDGYETNGPWAVHIDSNGKTTLTKVKADENGENSYELSKVSSERDLGYTDPFEISDKKIEYTLPSTGGNGTKALYMIGTLLSILGVIYVILKKGKGGFFSEKKNL